MCEKCGYSGCRHDWLKWDGKNYRRGMAAYLNNQKPTDSDEKNPAFNAGYYDEKHRVEYRPVKK